ncbi:hypothetical protein Tco_0309029 [Tanacetum coccineum]
MVQTKEYGYLFISFMIQHESYSHLLLNSAKSSNSLTTVTRFLPNEWDLASLKYSQETEGPYSTDLPTPDDIRRLLELERVMVDRTIKSQTVTLTPNQILTKELSPDMKQWEELIRENVFGLGGHGEPSSPPLSFTHVVLCFNVLLLLTNSRPQSDRGEARHTISSSSSHHHGTSLHQHDDDDDDVETSRASASISYTYLNLLIPLNQPKLKCRSASEQTEKLSFERQTPLLNQPRECIRRCAEQPSTKDTSSSSIDYIPKPPTSSTSLSPNSYLNPPTSPPPRVSPPPPTHENASMDITLTLSPITPLDVQFDTPSPSPPIVGHPIPWNLLEAHRDSCLCCIHNRTLIFGLRDELQYMFSYIEHMLSQPPIIIPPPPLSSPN